jgi:hypothetical protein
MRGATPTKEDAFPVHEDGIPMREDAFPVHEDQ